MAGTLKLTEQQWKTIRESMTKDFPGSYIIMRDFMQRELGFTTRCHREYDKNGFCICIDFNSDNAESWFILKYL